MSGERPEAAQDRAQRIAEHSAGALYASDRASQMLGMVIESVGSGRARVQMRVRADMVNGHGICHGGLIFALADSAFAFACNSHGHNTVAAGASIEFLAPGREGDLLLAVASEHWRRGRGGIYEIEVRNQRDEIVALFRGRSQQIAGRLVHD